MNYQVLGVESKKVYAEGSRRDCLRELHKKYPSSIPDPSRKHGIAIERIYPEPLRMVRIWN